MLAVDCRIHRKRSHPMPETLPAAADPDVFKVVAAGAGMPPIVLYRNHTWSPLQLPEERTDSGVAPPARFARAADEDLHRCVEGKKYSQLNAEERRIYNRLRKRKSDAKLA